MKRACTNPCLCVTPAREKPSCRQMSLLGSPGLRLFLPDLPGDWGLCPHPSPGHHRVAGRVHCPQYPVKGTSHTLRAWPTPGEFPQQLQEDQPWGLDRFLNVLWGGSHMGSRPFQGPPSSSAPSFPEATWSPRGNEKQRPGEALQKRLESVVTALRTEDTRGPRLLTMGTVALTWGLRASTPLQPRPDAVTRMRRAQGTHLGTQLQCVCLWRRPSLMEFPGQRQKGQEAVGVEATP